MLRMCSEGLAILLQSEETFREFAGLAERPKFLDVREPLMQAAVRISALAEWEAPEKRVNEVMRDDADNRFLELALAGHADLIVSGDGHLLDLKEYAGIPILRPAEAVAASGWDQRR